MEQLVYDIRKYKVILVLISMLLFSFIYMLVSDDEWYGINRMKDIVRDEVAREKVEEEVQDTEEIVNFRNIEGFDHYDKMFENGTKKSNNETELISAIDKAEEEVNTESIVKTPFENYFNRLYFSIVTGCLLGYGDIYPESIRLKGLVTVQALLTIIIIVM
jgi:hypothetical protein